MFKSFITSVFLSIEQRRGLYALMVGVCILIGINWTIYTRETLLTEGRVVLLELAPVDPRSLMQGDFMALRFQVANEAFPNVNGNRQGIFMARRTGDLASDGFLLLDVDAHGVGHFKKIAQKNEPLQNGQVLMRYRIRNDQVKFATNAFFFEEGQAAHYANAKYGAFRVAENGDMLLTALHGADYAQIHSEDNIQ